jgi:hypothetical protein
MKDFTASGSSWARTALSVAVEIANASPGRGSATQAEANAAETVRRQLVSLGIGDIQQQPFWGLRSIWLFFALAFGCWQDQPAGRLRCPSRWQPSA